MFFYALTSAGPHGGGVDTRACRSGFKRPPRDPANVLYQKTMFERDYCINLFCHLKTLGKHLEKFIL